MVEARVHQTGASVALWGPQSGSPGGHEQGPSLGSFAGAFTSIAKPKCHDIKHSPVKLKFQFSLLCLRFFLLGLETHLDLL